MDKCERCGKETDNKVIGYRIHSICKECNERTIKAINENYPPPKPPKEKFTVIARLND